MKYNKIVSVNETFQFSINLQFDINNISKIQEYIPTKDSCEVMEYYINSLFGNFSKATTLIGPYGKGKSHLLLVLLTILNDYNKEDEKVINQLLVKIKKINSELWEKITSLRQEKSKYMPVIINSNYNNMNQAFLLALSEALDRENLKELVVDTYFDIALKVIEKWENEGYKEAIDKFNICLSESNVSLKELKKMLSLYNEDGYNIFKRVYSCIMHGIEFNPLINTDIIKYYKDINYRINQKGYKGIIVVFDEFSKFLEYVGNENMMKDLKLLQDFAELATRTGKSEQILLSCITHKAINEYIKNLREDKVNAFKTVEGRFKEIYFNRSMEQNYEIVSQTILKTERFNATFEEYKKKNKELYEKIKLEFPFAKTENCEEILFRGCFPLNPITVYAVISLSEKIAQNERTLFTFLTDNDNFSLKTFINNNEVGELLGIDRIYDYFSLLLKKESDEYIKSIWIKAENALNKDVSDVERKIIKSVAVIYMLNDFDMIPPTLNNITLSLGMKEKEINTGITLLINNGILKKKKASNLFDFTTVYNKEVVKEIEKTVASKFALINEKETLNKIVDLGYIIPRRYNQTYKMTRFFKMIFMTHEEVMSLKNFNVLFKEYKADGIVINLIKTTNNSAAVGEKIKLIKDDRVILRVPQENISEEIFESLKEYEAIQYIRRTEENENEVQKELTIIEQEICEMVQQEINKKFEEIKIYYYKAEEINFISNLGAYISQICEEIYYNTPIINNEMINKDEISAPIYKARNIVIESILENNKNLITSETSAEATIYKAVVEKQDTSSIKKVIMVIKEQIKKADNSKMSLDKLYDKLTVKPYGIRKGVLPILFTLALYEYSENVVLYYQNKEIDITANNISKTLENTEKYFITVQKGTKEKILYISNLLKIFNVTNTNNNRSNVKNLVNCMKKWVLSLPRIVRDLAETNEITCSNSYIEIKNELLKADLNNNEFLFDTICQMLKVDDYNKASEEINNMKELFDHYIEKYTNRLICDFKELFEHNTKSSLNIILTNWYKSINDKVKNTVIRFEIKQLFDYVKEINTYNELEIVENISYKLLGMYIEDWQDNTHSEFFNSLNSIFKEIDNITNSNAVQQEKVKISDGNNIIEKYINCTQISSIGSTLKNNIEDSIEEYGDSISESEKIKVLLQIIKKYM